MRCPVLSIGMTTMLVVVMMICAVPSGESQQLPVADVKQSIAGLGLEQYAAREAATQRLVTLAETAHKVVLAECVHAYQQTTDPEVKTRLREVMQRIVDRHLYYAPRGYLGAKLHNFIVRGNGRVLIKDRVLSTGAVWVTQVADETPAQKAGLEKDDFIIEVDGKPWKSGPAKFNEYIHSKQPGDKVNLAVLRGDSTNRVETTLSELPKEEFDKYYPPAGSRGFFERWLRDQLEPPPAPPSSP